LAHSRQKINPLQDAEPGKILHEMRNGEMAETEKYLSNFTTAALIQHHNSCVLVAII